MLKKLATNLLPWLLSGVAILAVTFVLIRPMRASDGMWRVFDDVHTVRTQEMVYELQHGQFPVRMLSQLGNGGGYLLFNFYSPFTYYLTALLVFLGTSPLNAAKLAFQFAYVLAAVGMFGFLKAKFTKDWIVPVFGSLLLISTPYFNYDAYTRGALGELLGFALIPWVFLSYELLKTTKHWFWSFVFAIVVSLQLYIHAISAFITLPFLALYLGFDLWTKQLRAAELWKVLVAGLVGFGLSATYFLPMLFEKADVQYAQAEFVAGGYKNGFLAVTELLGFSRASDLTIKPLTIGLVLAGAGLVSLLGLLIKSSFARSDRKTTVPTAAFFMTSLGLCFVILTSISEVLWQHSSLIQMAQFPYRYLIIATFLLVWLIATGMNLVQQQLVKLGLASVVLLSSLFINHEFTQVSGYYFAGEFKAEDPCTTTTWQAEYLPKVTQLCLTKSNPAKLASSSGDLAVLTAQPAEKGSSIAIETNGQPGTLIVGKYAYPGWQLTSALGEKQLKPYGAEGILSAEMAAGETKLNLVFQDTLIRKIGNWLTVGTSLMTLLGLIRFWPWKFSKI